MASFIQSSDVDKARSVAEEALRAIHWRYIAVKPSFDVPIRSWALIFYPSHYDCQYCENLCLLRPIHL